MRKQSKTYYSVRDTLRQADPGLPISHVAQLARALIASGVVREVRTIVGPDGQPFGEVQP